MYTSTLSDPGMNHLYEVAFINNTKMSHMTLIKVFFMLKE